MAATSARAARYGSGVTTRSRCAWLSWLNVSVATTTTLTSSRRRGSRGQAAFVQPADPRTDPRGSARTAPHCRQLRDAGRVHEARRLDRRTPVAARRSMSASSLVLSTAASSAAVWRDLHDLAVQFDDRGEILAGPGAGGSMAWARSDRCATPAAHVNRGTARRTAQGCRRSRRSKISRRFSGPGTCSPIRVDGLVVAGVQAVAGAWVDAQCRADRIAAVFRPVSSMGAEASWSPCRTRVGT